MKISIHVPAWGTTRCHYSLSRCQYNFNPRSRVGNDQTDKFKGGSVLYFNPRSRVGNDSRRDSRSPPPRIFQSTFPRGERRVLTQSCQPGLHISIHVPAWGTTVSPLLSVPFNKFQSTFPRGERPSSQVLSALLSQISIHVPAWGTTANFNNFSLIYLYK